MIAEIGSQFLSHIHLRTIGMTVQSSAALMRSRGYSPYLYLKGLEERCILV